MTDPNKALVEKIACIIGDGEFSGWELVMVTEILAQARIDVLHECSKIADIQASCAGSPEWKACAEHIRDAIAALVLEKVK
jgi:hypothetical protein